LNLAARAAEMMPEEEAHEATTTTRSASPDEGPDWQQMNDDFDANNGF
jgi:hypothetical protein